MLKTPYIPGCHIRFDVGKDGVEGELPRDHVTASSYYETSRPQEFGEFSDGWCAKDTTNGQYLQVGYSLLNIHSGCSRNLQ